ncbi:MAG: glutamate--tRNA ligase [Acidiferrobacter sp.]
MDPVTTRFAPSPSGLLHLGNIRTALFSLLAALPDGRFLVRIEDTDRARVQADYQQALRTDLTWLGFDRYIDAEAILIQSTRSAIYADYLATLVARGAAYPCFCTPAALAAERDQARASGRAPRYSGRCALLSPALVAAARAAGTPAALRFRVPPGASVTFTDRVYGAQAIATDLIGDFVIQRAQGDAAFFFTNAIDDALSGVTLVLRGEDHLSNTARQILILEALALPVPAYGHLPLVLDADGAVLSKRAQALSLAALRAEGFLPLAVINYLARLGVTIGHDRLASLDELAQAFAVDHISRAPAHFDRQQLVHWQRRALAAMTATELAAWVPAQVPVAARARFLAAIRPNALGPADFAHWAAVLYGEPLTPSAEAAAAIAAGGPLLLTTALAALAGGVAPTQLPGALRDAGLGGRRLFHGLRAALTGALTGPEMSEILALMPAVIVEQRLRDVARTYAQNL